MDMAVWNRMESFNVVVNFCYARVSDDRLPIQVAGDGNCFFHTFSMAVVGNTSLAGELGLRVAIGMVKHKGGLMKMHQGVLIHSLMCLY